MRDPASVQPHSCTETYHGTRMNQKALTFHTKLHEWNEAQKLSSNAQRHLQQLNSAKSGEVYLPVKKLAHIEYWTKEVNKYYRPNRNGRPRTGSFMKIDVSKYNMKVDKNEDRRSRSAIYPSRSGDRAFSAVSRATTGGRRRFFGTDVHTVKHNLIESQIHYSAQRKDIYSGKKQTTTGETNKANNAEEQMEEISPENGYEDESTMSDTLTTGENSSSIVSEFESHNRSPIESGVLQPKIVARSWSNKMLNVISIDDCKLTCRYRPQIIKETHIWNRNASKKKVVNDTEKELPQETESVPVVKLEGVDNGNGHEADDELGSSEDTHGQIEAKMDSMQLTDKDHPDQNDETSVETIQEKAEPTSQESQTPELVQNHVKQTNGEVSSNGSVKKKVHIRKERKELNGDQSMAFDSSSKMNSKTSYGRITNLYSNSESSKLQSKDVKKKMSSRKSQINKAIGNMIKDRTVMNSMERDFDTKTAEFGRTIVEKSEGSETFKKIHANLRKRIDNFVDTHSAIKTLDFYEKCRNNSTQSSNDSKK